MQLCYVEEAVNDRRLECVQFIPHLPDLCVYSYKQEPSTVVKGMHNTALWL